ncbi:5 TM domain-containing transmembrane protein [Acrasis kona]|uniref:5 TM domain-containing transmembrane protein n=1 Tax=Acrasis kona TaxID=1008807 RepID=A0AAW2ZCT1_9EUKA
MKLGFLLFLWLIKNSCIVEIIQRKKGISNINMAMYYVVVIVIISGINFLGSTGPYVLTKFAKVPKSEQGRATGDISLFTECVKIPCIWILGSFSDSIRSRKPIFLIGFTISALAISFIPMTTSFYTLLATRMSCSVGLAALLSVYLATIADYTSIKDRGKATGLVGLCLNIASLFNSFVLVNMPVWISGDGKGYLTTTQAGYVSFTIMSVYLLLVGVLSLFLLHDGEFARKEKKFNKNEIAKPKRNIIIRTITIFVEAITAMKDPLVALSYLAAFVSRMDANVSSFNSLWLIGELEEAVAE